MVKQATEGDQSVELKQAVMNVLKLGWTHLLACTLVVIRQPLPGARVALPGSIDPE